MRMWSISPKYLDKAGLGGCWRETLLAKKVLEGNTRGYKNHSQLIRFKSTNNPLFYINKYLHEISNEANLNRGYKYNKYKIDYNLINKYDSEFSKINVTTGQINYELQHIMRKLKNRDITKYLELINIVNNGEIEVVSIFNVVPGDIEPWEKT